MLLYQAAPNQVAFYTLILYLFKVDYIVSFELFHISIFPDFHLRRRHFLIATNTVQYLNKIHTPSWFCQVSKPTTQTNPLPSPYCSIVLYRKKYKNWSLIDI